MDQNELREKKIIFFLIKEFETYLGKKGNKE